MHHTEYDKKFWDTYADENEERYDGEFASLLSSTASGLGCSHVLEIGCGTGIDLRLMPDGVATCGLDPSSHALAIARYKMPAVDFTRGMITWMPFADSSVDLVFTHGLLNYLDDKTLEDGMHEMYRVSRRYIMSYERFGETEECVDGRQRSRNMARRWHEMGAVIMIDAPIHSSAHVDEDCEDVCSNSKIKVARVTLVRVTRREA